MAGINRHLEVEALFLTPGEQYMFVSSSMVREIARFGGAVTQFVRPAVERRLKQRVAGTPGTERKL